MSIQVRKTRNVDITFQEEGGAVEKEFRLVRLPATKAYEYFLKVTSEGGVASFTANEIKDLVVLSLEIDAKKYEVEFSGQMMALLKLVNEIVEFNFEDVFQGLASAEQSTEEA